MEIKFFQDCVFAEFVFFELGNFSGFKFFQDCVFSNQCFLKIGFSLLAVVITKEAIPNIVL